VRRAHRAESGNGRAIVFSTLVNHDVRAVVRRANALVIDFFESFIDPLEAGLGVKSSHTIGRSHSAMDKKEYAQRMEAINFSMAHDDGASHRELGQADVILVGVSRSGKTPTSLYLALQFGVKAANYPLIPEDFQRGKLPEALRAQKTRLYGLTIAPERLHEIRKERRPGSRYAELDNCRFEVEEAESMMRREGHPQHQLDHEVDRGDRHHHPARAAHPAARSTRLFPQIALVQADRGGSGHVQGLAARRHRNRGVQARLGGDGGADSAPLGTEDPADAPLPAELLQRRSPARTRANGGPLEVREARCEVGDAGAARA
jgi:regulator of PEP synthase PpsR (kinase-PPPase family)